MSKFLRYRKTGHIVTLTMNEPDSMNALSGPDQYADFEKYCARINQDYDVRCVILTGAGKAFSAGGNVKAMQERNRKGQPPSVVIRDWYKNGIQRIPMAFYNLEVPTIAAVNGAATGAGCDLTCMADIRIASTFARFAETFVKIGISPGDGGAYFLPRVISNSNAAEMVFTGELINADKALEIGLVSKVVEAKDLMKEAKALAERIADNPPHALRLSKTSALDGTLRCSVHRRRHLELRKARPFENRQNPLLEGVCEWNDSSLPPGILGGKACRCHRYPTARRV